MHILLSESLVQSSPLSKNCTHPERAKGLTKSLWTPRIQHTYRLVDTTELWAPERPDTETVSFPKQSISWTPDIKHETHTTIIHYLFITHTYFSFQICTYQTCTHIIVYIIYFVHCLFVYYSLLSVSCPVAAILLHCRASVSITNSSYV